MVTSEIKKQEVWVNSKDIAKVDDAFVERLIAQAKANPRKRMRLCLHKSSDDAVHEMIIAIAKDCYIRPHKHPQKTESFHIVKGSLWLFVFDHNGNVIEKFKMSERGNSDCFLYRLQKDYWHGMIPISDFVVFHETTKGPFTGQNDSVFPDWAPGEDDPAGKIKAYLTKLLSVQPTQ